MYPSHILLVVLMVWVSNASYQAVSQQGCHPEDQKALLQIKQELGNPSLLSSWDPNTSQCCSNFWRDVYCTNINPPYRVNQLTLNGLDLPGAVKFPQSITNLPYLNNLIIGDMPNLTGTIPPSITKLTKLQVFYIDNTNVSGPVPEFIAQLKALLSIAFSNSNFSGPLPGSLPQLPNIRVVALNGNRITGPIPESYGSFKLTTLLMSHNELSGKIPASLGKLSVYYLDLSANNLEGDASMLFGADKYTGDINLSRNKLEFDLGKVEFGENITNLNLKYNRIYGRIPEGLTNLKHLIRLNVSHNNLCGQIPQGGTGRLQSFFDGYCYAHNKCLCGSPLPTCN